jgi:hypothetical protein
LLGIRSRPGLELTFGSTTFFEAFDVKQSIAHEFKAAWLNSGGSIPGWQGLPFRSSISDQFDPARLVMSPGISTLTIRRDHGGEHRFVLHERDGAAVADGGGASSGDYVGAEPFRSFERARSQGRFRLWHYGLTLDPLTLVATQPTVAVIDDQVFDQLFAGLVTANGEGRPVGMHGRSDLPFTAEAIARLDPRLSANSLTLLRLAWRDRQLLLRG